ncbi:hypothetical protein EON65_14740 [archaeon]|nr:MAG: hypothetical protein EON65_14740 [archaeon]
MKAFVNLSARSLLYRSRSALQQTPLYNRPFLVVRPFSNEKFKKTLEDVKKKAQEPRPDPDAEDMPKVDEDGNVKKTPESEQTSQSGENAEAGNASSDTVQAPSFMENAAHYTRKSYSFLVDNIREAYREMIGSDKESMLVKQVNTENATKKANASKEEDETEAEPEAGPSAIVVVKEGQSAWDQMKERLQEAPFIREVLKRSRTASKAAAETDLGKTVVNMGKSVQDKVSDFREYWETSQNPIVYTLSGVVDTLTGETEEAMAVTAIRKLDPKFIKEEWAEEVKRELVPHIIKAHLEGDIKVLKMWCGEAVYSKLAADIATRKHDGYKFSGHLLEVSYYALFLCIYMIVATYNHVYS